MKQLASELNHLYFAFNAIDYVLTCGLFELARRPELVRLLRAEWTTVLKDRTHPGREDFAALPKTVAFMREIFRLYPVSMTVQRRTGALLEVGDETLPSGSHVAILLYALHRHPEFWERGDELDIERWQAKPRVDFSYVPFLDGPRKCIGRHLGELHFLVVLHAILSKRDLLIDDDLAVQSFAMPRLERPLRATARARTA